MTTLQQALVAPFTRARQESPTRVAVGNRGFLAFFLASALSLAAALLGLNSWLTAGAFEVRSLQKQSSDLQRQQQQLGESVSMAQSSARLAQRAAQLGMIPAQDPVFLVVRDTAADVEPASTP